MLKNRLYATPPVSPNFDSSGRKSNGEKTPKPKRQSKKTLSGSGTSGTSKQKVRAKENEKSSKESYNIMIPESDPDLNSDSGDEAMFFSKPDSRLPYTREEDEIIAKYVLKGENIFKTTSILLWKFLERKKETPKRTYQSLKNRFLRNIKPHLFTNFRHLIKDKETVERILTKFPELKKSMQNRQNLATISLPERKRQQQEEENRSEMMGKKQSGQRAKSTVRTEDNGVSSTIDAEDTEETNLPAKVSKPQAPSPDIFLSRAHPRSVASRNGSFVVTVDLRKYSSDKNPQSLGIYQKFLKHKNNNVIEKCSKCGRGGFEGYQSIDSDSDTDCEGRLVIASPPQTPSRRNSPEICTPAKRKKKKNKPSETLSPSLLKDTTTEEDQNSPNSSKKKKEVSQELLTDQDLEALYWNTVAFCQTLTNLDSDEEESERSGDGTIVKPATVRSPSRDSNLESFFLKPGTSKENPAPAPEARVESENMLLKNMTKMLKAVEERS